MMQIPLTAITLGWLLAAASLTRASEPLTLNECVSRALTTIPRLAEAGAAVDLSAAQQREVAASLFPTVRSDIAYLQEPGYREVITNRGLSAGQLIADYLVYDGGRRTSQLHAARFAEQASQFGLAAARNQVVFETTVAFYGLIHASQIARELQANTQRLSRYTAVLQALRSSGRATVNDVLRIDVILRDSRVQLNAALHNRARASLALGALIGDYGHDDIAVSEPPGDMVQLSSGTVDNSPALEVLERSRASAGAGLQAASAERYPTLRMELTAGFLGTDPPSTVRNNAGASYGGLLSIPLFEGGAIRARIDQARARVLQADAQLAQARIDLSERLAEARSRYDEARQSLALLQESLPAADGSFELSWSRFLGGGNATLLEVIDSYNQALATRLGLADQQFATRQAAAEITQLTATGRQ
jgi:outer membrane protein TolC